MQTLVIDNLHVVRTTAGNDERRVAVVSKRVKRNRCATRAHDDNLIISTETTARYRAGG